MNEELQRLTKRLVNDLKSLSGTDFTDDSPYNEMNKQLLYDNCKAIIEHLDLEHCRKLNQD